MGQRGQAGLGAPSTPTTPTVPTDPGTAPVTTPGTGTPVVPGTTGPGIGVGTAPPANQTPYQSQDQYQSGSGSMAQTQTGTGNTDITQQQNNANVYNAGSLGLQNQGAQALAQILAGGDLQGFGMNGQAFDALNSAFERNVAPQLAAQYGSGSTAIGSQEALMNEQLAAQLSQQQWANFNNVFDDVSNFAFTPTGQTATNNQQQQTAENQQTDQTNNWQSNNLASTNILTSLLNLAKQGKTGGLFGI